MRLAVMNASRTTTSRDVKKPHQGRISFWRRAEKVFWDCFFSKINLGSSGRTRGGVAGCTRGPVMGQAAAVAALSSREIVDWCHCLPSAVRLPSALNSSAI